MPGPRLVFFGTADLSAAVLGDLHAAGFDIAAAVTQPDRTRGRNRHTLVAPEVKRVAESLGIRVMQPERCKNPAFLAELAALNADIYCVFAFGQILPQALLDQPPKGIFNAHASLLPRWRGAAPINWAIVEGDSETGMTIQRVVFKLDAGPICWKKAIPIEPRETAETLREKMIPLAGEGLIEVVRAAWEGTLQETPQNESAATYAPIMKKNDGLIDWSESAQAIDRRVRGFYPWPSATTFYNGDSVRLFDVLPRESAAPSLAHPGEILDVSNDGILVACGRGTLLVRELQRQGKKRMDACAFLCGCRVSPGERFTTTP